MGINKSVSNKVARHTNAQLWIRLGTNRPVVSRILGHSKEETTKTYYNIDINEVIDGTNHMLLSCNWIILGCKFFSVNNCWIVLL